MAFRTRGLKPTLSSAAAFRRLAARPDVAVSIDVARDLSVPIRVVGGAVRDAFLGLSGGDLDLSVAPNDAERVTAALARALGSRVLRIGAEGRGIHRVVWSGGEVDVWERTSTLEEDRDRRDFTINALAFDLPDGTFDSPETALDDLTRRLLRPPRAGVFLEDPLRVLRGARLLARFEGFRVATSALPEIRRAAARLRDVARERRLTELDLLLAERGATAAAALSRLVSWGAALALFPGMTPRELSRGLRVLGRAGRPSVPLARLVVVHAAHDRGRLALESLGVPRRDLQMAAKLLALPLRRQGRVTVPRDVVFLARRTAPFAAEAAAYLTLAGDAGTRRLARAMARRLRRSGVSSLVSPPRPVTAPEIAAHLGLAEGPELGAALAELDTALAAGEIRGRRHALLHLDRWTAARR